MRKALLAAVIIYLSIHAQPLTAACKTEACKQATAWKNGYTAIVLDDSIGRKEYFAVLDAVKANRGVVAIEAERVLLGWVPLTAAGKIRAVHGVAAVLYEAAPNPADLVRSQEALEALSYFNHVRTGEFEDSVEAGLARRGEPLTGCVKSRPTPTSAQSHISTSALPYDSHGTPDLASFLTFARTPIDGEDTKMPGFSGVVSPKFLGRTPYQNPSMRGRITVQLFRLDSDGSLDPNSYTWSDADLGKSRDQVYSAFTFWVNQAAMRNITLSFTVKTMDPFSRFTRSIYPTPTQYEPITHFSTDDYLWINDALTPLGYGSSTLTQESVFSQNDAFNRAKAADPTYGPFDGSYSVYIVYNPSPAPSVFRDNQRAYTYADGPFVMMMWNSGGWGPDNMGVVLTHESAHIFWACDEYYYSQTDGCQTCSHCFLNIGPRNQQATPWVTNGNCDYTGGSYNPDCDVPRTACIMKSLTTVTLCSHTPAQIGW